MSQTMSDVVSTMGCNVSKWDVASCEDDTDTHMVDKGSQSDIPSDLPFSVPSKASKLLGIGNGLLC
jgi:hypothetical protein